MMCGWHLTPLKITTKMCNNILSKRWKCRKEDGTHDHIRWTCDDTKRFWLVIHRKWVKIIGIPFQMKPDWFLLIYARTE